MEMIMLVLFGLSLLLLIISFFQKDPYKEVKEEIDQLTLQQVQELYQLKKKISILEEELLVPNDDFLKPASSRHKSKREIHDIIKNQVWALAQQGKPIEQIASLSSLSPADVYEILEGYTDRGKINE
ncbi:hypothetical protein ACF5W4_12600 [Bacillota bacterium Lsc_1132]